MNKIVLKSTLLVGLFACAPACTETQNIDMNKPVERSAEYYRNLREYKKSDHTICFGWIGGHTAEGASMRSRLDAIPDSMDIVSIWSGSTTPIAKADMERVQKLKGTKVLFTIFSHNIGEDSGLENTAENIPAYAKFLADKVNSGGYDGLDLDHEAGSGELFYEKANFTLLLKELGKYIGPASGTGKLLTVDGHIEWINPSCEPYISYVISQAYGTYYASTLDGGIRYGGVYPDFSPAKYIATEDFEKYSQGGGVPFTYRDGRAGTNSLMGMAMWQSKYFNDPTNQYYHVKKAGFGAYHFENDYANPEGDYMYFRRAIQAANPSDGSEPNWDVL